jgi:hypothetical protein
MVMTADHVQDAAATVAVLAFFASAWAGQVTEDGAPPPASTVRFERGGDAGSAALAITGQGQP